MLLCQLLSAQLLQNFTNSLPKQDLSYFFKRFKHNLHIETFCNNLQCYEAIIFKKLTNILALFPQKSNTEIPLKKGFFTWQG